MSTAGSRGPSTWCPPQRGAPIDGKGVWGLFCGPHRPWGLGRIRPTDRRCVARSHCAPTARRLLGTRTESRRCTNRSPSRPVRTSPPPCFATYTACLLLGPSRLHLADPDEQGKTPDAWTTPCHCRYGEDFVLRYDVLWALVPNLAPAKGRQSGMVVRRRPGGQGGPQSRAVRPDLVKRLERPMLKAAAKPGSHGGQGGPPRN